MQINKTRFKPSHLKAQRITSKTIPIENMSNFVANITSSLSSDIQKWKS
jgi:hypothetical protein